MADGSFALVAIMISPLLLSPLQQIVQRNTEAIEQVGCMQDIVVMMAWQIFNVLVLEHLVNLRPGNLYRHLMGIGLVFLARSPMFLVFTVLLDYQIVGNSERLGIRIEEESRVKGHPAESGVVLAERIVFMTSHLRQALIAKNEGCLP